MRCTITLLPFWEKACRASSPPAASGAISGWVTDDVVGSAETGRTHARAVRIEHMRHAGSSSVAACAQARARRWQPGEGAACVGGGRCTTADETRETKLSTAMYCLYRLFGAGSSCQHRPRCSALSLQQSFACARAACALGVGWWVLGVLAKEAHKSNGRPTRARKGRKANKRRSTGEKQIDELQRLSSSRSQEDPVAPRLRREKARPRLAAAPQSPSSSHTFFAVPHDAPC